MDLFFLCSLSLFFLFLSLSLVSVFFFNHKSNASLPPPYHVWREDLGFLNWNVIGGTQPAGPAISDSMCADFSNNIPNGWKLYWNTSSTHKFPAGRFPEGTEYFDPSNDGKEYAQLEMRVFMHDTIRISYVEQCNASSIAKWIKAHDSLLSPLEG